MRIALGGSARRIEDASERASTGGVVYGFARRSLGKACMAGRHGDDRSCYYDGRAGVVLNGPIIRCFNPFDRRSS